MKPTTATQITNWMFVAANVMSWAALDICLWVAL